MEDLHIDDEREFNIQQNEVTALADGTTFAVINWNILANKLRCERMVNEVTNRDKLREIEQVYSVIMGENITRASALKLERILEMDTFKELIVSQNKICASEWAELHKAVKELDATEMVDGFVDVIFTEFYRTYLNYIEEYCKKYPQVTIAEFVDADSKSLDIEQILKNNREIYQKLYHDFVHEMNAHEIIGTGNIADRHEASEALNDILYASMGECIESNYTKFCLEEDDIEQFGGSDQFFTTAVMGEDGEEVRVGAFIDENYKIGKPPTFTEPKFRQIIDLFVEE